ncbi:adenylosuccinate lyase [Limisphaera ngatamarikiensis]|uniref:Adenylosuccinate lyase n=1 Tax=Limisphaera ngatamarikiensis TaxID=1324935 RepID=A0A6M1RNT6_9BACT|nr:adenylosuccinate lyase [Limisphaera ngatamarikiensis]NGO39097.1 adenylosuccinate lyase [Limisphaera ngatamarikiensis]
MIERYSRPEMRAIWSEENKLRLWLQIELLTTEALVRAGIVPAADYRRIRAGCQACLKDLPGLLRRQRELEQTLQHDVIAFTTAVAERINHRASRWLHYGLTSSDVVDTAFALQLVQSADLLLADLDALLPVIARRAREHKSTPCIGRSHGIHAEPITFGFKLAGMYDEFRRARRRLESARYSVAVGKLSGAVGTSAHLHPRIETYVCRKLGLRPVPVATQVVPRDLHAEFQTVLALIGASIERWAVEFRHLQRTEVLETEEPFGKGQKGSSAMPHKRNPITWERLTGLARILRANAMAALENVALWHERDISHSSVERVIFPDSCTLLDYMLHLLRRLMDGLQVYPENMRRNLGLSLGMYHSQTVLLALIRKGLTREEAYALVQRNAMKTWEVRHAGRDDADFLQTLKADPEVARHFEPGELERLCSLEFHFRHLPYRFKALKL